MIPRPLSTQQHATQPLLVNTAETQVATAYPLVLQMSWKTSADVVGKLLQGAPEEFDLPEDMQLDDGDAGGSDAGSGDEEGLEQVCFSLLCVYSMPAVCPFIRYCICMYDFAVRLQLAPFTRYCICWAMGPVADHSRTLGSRKARMLAPRTQTWPCRRQNPWSAAAMRSRSSLRPRVLLPFFALTFL